MRGAAVTLTLLLSASFAVAANRAGECSTTQPTSTKDGRLVCPECQDLPKSVKKHAVLGKQEDLPEGYFVYVEAAQPNFGPAVSDGLMISPLRKFQPQRVSNTRNATEAYISDDGRWLLVGSNPLRDTSGLKKLALIRLDGSGRTEVPLPGGACIYFGFYRNSPLGSEIYFVNAKSELHAMAVDLKGDVPKFGAVRSLGLSGIANHYRYGCYVSGEHVYGITGGKPLTETWFTISDGGKGTVEQSAAWRPGREGRGAWTCGLAMSNDGTLAAVNASFSGVVDGLDYTRCAPMGGTHTGPVILPYKKPSDPTYKSTAEFHIREAVSINWCPLEFYTTANDFHMWRWSNDNDYMSCRRYFSGKTRGPNDGDAIYVLHIPSNTWTRVTGLDKPVLQSAVFIQKGAESLVPAKMAPQQAVSLNVMYAWYKVDKSSPMRAEKGKLNPNGKQDCDIPDFAKMTPSGTGRMGALDSSAYAQKDGHYGAVVKAPLNIEKPGDYTFRVVNFSTSYVELTIDGKLVLDSNQEAMNSGAKTALAAGTHELVLTMYTPGSDPGNVQVMYEGPGTASQPIPESAFASLGVAGSRPLTVEATVVEASKVPALADLGIYNHVLYFVKYRVEKVLDGQYDQKELVVAHWAVRDRKYTPSAGYKPGDRQIIRCDPLAGHAEPGMAQQANDIGDLTLLPYMALDVRPAASQPSSRKTN
jgi:hypothetical protein